MTRTDHSLALESLLRTQRPALVAMLERRIPRRLRAIVGADDIAQEAALEAVRSIGTFRAAGEDSLRNWVWQIARHRLCDVLRAHRRAKRGAGAAAAQPATGDACPLESLPCDAACPSRAAALTEDVSQLRHAIERLPESYRRAVRARYLDCLPVHEAAALLGRTPGALGVLCSRALKLLREQLQAPRAGRFDAAGGVAACPVAGM